MDIKEIALKVGLQAFEEHPYDKGHVVSPSGYTWIDDKLIEFAEILIAEIAKQNEPVGWFKYDKVSRCWHPQYDEYAERYAKEQGWQQLYTYPPTAEQIANETAEAIAKMLESGSFLSTESKVALAANGAAKAIRRGAWKEFRK